MTSCRDSDSRRAALILPGSDDSCPLSKPPHVGLYGGAEPWSLAHSQFGPLPLSTPSNSQKFSMILHTCAHSGERAAGNSR